MIHAETQQKNHMKKQFADGQLTTATPVGTLTSNGHLLNVHIGPVDVQKGRSIDV